jgi:hypothetical protein
MEAFEALLVLWAMQRRKFRGRQDCSQHIAPTKPSLTLCSHAQGSIVA